MDEKTRLRDEDLNQVSGGRYTGPVFMYTIQPEDTLTMLAHRFGTTVRVLQELNGYTNPDMIRAGDTMMIPQR